jgi:DNA-binding CsgD family transcriptional regulator
MDPTWLAPLVGRTAELARLEVALDQADGGRGGLVLVAGEPGIGKTRLVEELAARAADRDALVVWGRIDEEQGAPPYWPWVQLLDAAFAGHEREALVEALDGAAGPLAAIVPHVAALVPGAAPTPAPEAAQARFRLHQSVADVLARLSRRRCLIVVLEDLHWADVASLELTRFLASRLTATGLLVVATYRSVDAGSSTAFDDVLASLARQPLERIELHGLSEPEVERFIAQTVDLRAGAALVSAVYARTEGNPFFVGELARLLDSEGLLAGASGGAAAVPAGVRDVVRRRLARLPDDTRELLGLGAVVGRDFDVVVLAAAAAVPELEALERLDPAISAGLIAGDAGSAARMRFSHALVRDAIYNDLNALRRATLHARVGDALERHAAPGTRRAELAEHFLRGAPIAGPERGLAYALAAAEAAQSALAYERAEDDLRRALGLIEVLPAGTARLERELEVQNRLVALMTLTRGYAAPEVGRACARAVELCEQLGETGGLFKALSNLAVFYLVHSDFALAGDVAVRQVAVGEQRASPLWLAAGHLLLGVSRTHRGLLSAALESFASARDAAAELELTAEVADSSFGPHPLPIAHVYAARAAWIAGDEREARALADEGVRLATGLGHPHTVAFAWYHATHVQILLGDAAATLAWSERAIAYCEEHGLANLRCWFRVFHGWAICEHGRPEEGADEMAAACAENRATGARINSSVFRGLLSEGEARRGNRTRALAIVDEALAVRGEDGLFQSDLLRRRGELLAAGGPDERGAGLATLRAAVDVAEAQGAIGFRDQAAAALERLGVAGGDAAPDCNLSPRERELLGLVGRGLTDKEIAAALVISLATVRSHLDRIRDKTGRRRRPELTRLADELGLSGA